MMDGSITVFSMDYEKSIMIEGALLHGISYMSIAWPSLTNKCCINFSFILHCNKQMLYQIFIYFFSPIQWLSLLFGHQFPREGKSMGWLLILTH